MIAGCAHLCARRLTHQVDSDAGSYEVSHVDVDWVTAMLCYLCQAGEAGCHAESKHQQRFEQLGCAVDAGVEIHLWRETRTHKQAERDTHTHVARCNAFLWSGYTTATHTSTQVGAELWQDFIKEIHTANEN